MAIKILENQGVKWVHIDQVDGKSLKFLKEKYKFHHLDLEDVASERQRPKIDIYKYYLFIVFVFPYYDKEKNKIRGREVDVFLSRNSLVTISKKSFPLFSKLFSRCQRNEKIKNSWFSQGSDFLLYKLLEILFKDSAKSLDYIGNYIAEIEDDVYEEELKNITRDLAHIRRGVLALRRMIDPQRFTINTLVNIEREFIDPNLSVYFDDVHDHVEKMWVVIENYKDTIDGLHLTNESLISQHTNKVIQILTIFSVALLPLTLLAGIYGMNIVLPFSDRPLAIWSLFGIFILIILIILLILKKKKWF